MKEKIVATILISLLMIAGVAIANTGATARGPPSQGPPGCNIVEVLVEVNEEEDGEFEGEFDILIAAVEATPEVADILTGNGQRTVFGPTDSAFEALADDLDMTVEELIRFLLDNPKYLEDVLLYHIAHGRLYAGSVVRMRRINTLRRGRDGFLMQDETVLTDNLGREANIIFTDVEAANGIIHVIDAVVLPYLPELTE